MTKWSGKHAIVDPAVLAAMRRVNREAFLPPELREQARADQPLPIGAGQTISQPYIVALMSQVARIGPNDRCLEVGTGSGFQTAVLLELASEVFSVEYLEELAELARKNLAAQGYVGPRLHLRVGDGYQGWPEAAPFDVILVTAAPPSVPLPLLEQLALGGRLVIPVGEAGEVQRLERWTRHGPLKSRGAFEREHIADVRFVPFLGPGVSEASAGERTIRSG